MLELTYRSYVHEVLSKNPCNTHPTMNWSNRVERFKWKTTNELKYTDTEQQVSQDFEC
jgi:hypothetical protein